MLSVEDPKKGQMGDQLEKNHPAPNRRPERVHAEREGRLGAGARATVRVGGARRSPARRGLCGLRARGVAQAQPTVHTRLDLT